MCQGPKYTSILIGLSVASIVLYYTFSKVPRDQWYRNFRIINQYTIRPSNSWDSIFSNENKEKVKKKPTFFLQSNRPLITDGFYITAWPDHGAGVGHQFGEWLQGLWAAYQYNITYVYTPFLINSAYWSSFLGFGVGELIEDDIKNHYNFVDVREIPDNSETQDSLKQTIIKYRNNRMNQTLDGTAIIIRLYRTHRLISYFEGACFRPVNVKLRMKYCARRVDQPVFPNLYKTHREANNFIVAVHLRCGDSCYDSYRATSLSSIENTILKLNSDIAVRYPGREVAFHLFSQPPVNNTAENHFRPLLHSEKLRKANPKPIMITTHFSLNAPITLHHLIMSDLLITAQSSFSLLAAILRVGITFGAVSGCHAKLSSLDYDRNTGNYSSNILQALLAYNEYLESKSYTTNKLTYLSREECFIYEIGSEIWNYP